MTPEEICQLLQRTFPDVVEEAVLAGAHPYVVVRADGWPDVARFLRDDPRCGFNLLRCISSLDLIEENKLAAIYDLCAVPRTTGDAPLVCPHQFAVRVVTDRSDPHIPSVADVWEAADWHEREAFDLMGIVFDNHPDPRRILCPDDWEGHPLRKDYVFPKEYHGTPGTTEWEMPNPRH